MKKTCFVVIIYQTDDLRKQGGRGVKIRECTVAEAISRQPKYNEMRGDRGWWCTVSVNDLLNPYLINAWYWSAEGANVTHVTERFQLSRIAPYVFDILNEQIYGGDMRY